MRYRQRLHDSKASLYHDISFIILSKNPVVTRIFNLLCGITMRYGLVITDSVGFSLFIDPHN